MNRYVILPLLITSLLALSIVACNSGKATTESSVSFDENHQPSMRGLCWVAGDSIASHNLNQVSSIGANWISQTPFGDMTGIDDSNVGWNNVGSWFGEADRGLRHTTALAKEAGIKTMLKPHIWIRKAEGKWRSDIAMNSEEEWENWFTSYKSWIMHYAELAEETGMEALCIGTELSTTTKEYPEKWREIIKSIREVYSGELTYAANWYDDFEHIEFWDELDYIGIQAYFPLTKNVLPTKNELIKAWKKHAVKLEAIAKKFDKKIVFTEIGYKNTADAAREPWTWPQKMEEENVQRSDETQKICYEALFESVWQAPWMDGVFIWKWFHSTYKHETFKEYFAKRDEWRTNYAKKHNRKYGRAIYFSPQRTEALEVLKKWYLKPVK